MAMKKISLGVTAAFVVTGIFLTVLTSGVLTASQSVPSSGTITGINVGVYSDPSCTQNCTTLDWGSLAPGATATKTIYVKNTGNIPVTLSMTTGNWAPSSASGYLTLSWNRQNTVVATGGSVMATLTLTASSSAGAISTFSFNVVITGTQ